MPDAIVLERVSKSFPKAVKASLAETSLRIEAGEFITVLGASGSGKTTLLKLINRLLEPSTGQIYIHGENIQNVPPAQLRRKIGYVIQQIGLFPHLSVEENIATVPKLLGWRKPEIQERVTELLTLVELEPTEFRKRYPRQLSGGQQQRVGLARALAAKPALLLMDEPFGAIDAITRTSLQDELLRIQKKLGTTVLFITHDIPEALKLGDRVIVMNEGQVQQFDTPHRILTQPANAFVRALVGADEPERQFGFIRAREVMIAGTAALNGQLANPAILKVREEQSLQDVLSTLLAGPLDTVLITDNRGEVTGHITLDRLRELRHGKLPQGGPSE